MGVNVLAIERSFEPPAMTRLEHAEIARAPVWGERRPSYYIIDTRGNGGAIVINRALKAGVEAKWLAAPFEIEGYRYPAGSLVIGTSKSARTVVESAAAEFGFELQAPRDVRQTARGRFAPPG